MRWFTIALLCLQYMKPAVWLIQKPALTAGFILKVIKTSTNIKHYKQNQTMPVLIIINFRMSEQAERQDQSS